MRKFAGLPVCLLALLAVGADKYWDISGLKVDKPEDKQDVKSVPAPKGAIVLFDGTNLDQWTSGGGKAAKWKLVEGKALEVKPGTGNLFSRRKFDGHFKLHVEFRVPYMPDRKDQARGNSGVYLQGRYEVQILDSYHNPTYPKGGCGAIYEVADPRVKAYKAPAVWQSYDIDFHSPRCANGKVAEPPRITAYHNGLKIHDKVKIPVSNTRAGAGGDPCKPGPVMLQDHGTPVQFRNIWVVTQKE